jgi:hypothetical protein
MDNIKDLEVLNFTNEIDFINGENNKCKIFAEDINGRYINLYKLKNVQFVGDNLFYPNILAHSHNDNSTYKIIREKIMSLEKIKSLDCNFNIEPCFNYYDDPLFFFIYNFDNYFHFIYDTLPYLISYNHIKKHIPNIKLLVNYPTNQTNKLYNFVTEFLELCDITINDLVFIKDGVQYKNVYISNSYTHDLDSNLPPRSEIYDFYRNIVKNCLNTFSDDTPKKIYISRRTYLHNNFDNIGTNYTTRRTLSNETDLVNFLQTKGYVEVFTENMSTKDKLNLFYNAESIVGSIGGGLCNVLFSKPETNLICLVSPTFLDVNYRFIYSLNKVKLKLFNNSYHTEKSKFKKYMRVQSKIDGLVGEIFNINDNKLEIKYDINNISGWNNQNTYQTIILNDSDCIKLDNGLNSNWVIDLESFKCII